MDVKRLEDRIIKIPGVRIERSNVLKMKEVAKDKGMSTSALYREVVGKFLEQQKK